MIDVINSDVQHLEYTREFRHWVDNEWGKVDPFDTMFKGIKVPSPVFAVEHRQLVGGLAFSWAEIKTTFETKLWINAVIVRQEYRGKGIASALIQRASSLAESVGETQIFAYTEYPDLYRKNGWQVETSTNADYVMRLNC